MNRLKKLMAGREAYLLLGLGVLVLDQWSKWLVEEKLPLRQAIEVLPGLLNLLHVRNTGIAFGLFASGGNLAGTLVLTVLGLGGLSLLGVYFFRTPRSEPWMLASLGLILGGAVGNLADRIASGSVTDFLDFYYGSYHWYTFNVADSAITVGILLMSLQILFSRTVEPAPAATETRDSSTE